jgi:hydroxylysine kinase
MAGRTDPHSAADQRGPDLRVRLESGLGSAFDRTPVVEAGAIVGRIFGISVDSAVRLDTERDDTFAITASGSGGPVGAGQSTGPGFVLKISHPGDDQLEIDLQSAAVAHAASRDPGLPLPRLVPALGEARHGDRAVRLIRYLPGRLLGEVTASPPELRRVGRMLGRLTLALADFEHPAADRWLAWDLRHAGSLAELLPALDGAERRRAIGEVLDRLSAETLPALAATPRQVVHNDFNGGNLVVDRAAPDFVTGILDFGDAVRSHRAADLAIALSYAGGYACGADGPWAPAAAVAAGYLEVNELPRGEIALIPQLVLGRLAQRLLLGSWLAAARPENAGHLARNIEASWRQFLALRESFPPDGWQGQ